jgi:glycosyltransferase involved in cell wall biosynthesis
MSEKPYFSVIIPALNASRTLEKTLKSIREQDYDQDKIEIVLIDGGSTDDTRDIAVRYGCRVLDNPMVQQEHAKFIGLNEAAGSVVVFADTDEVFGNPDSFAARERILRDHPEYKFILGGGYRTPPGALAINDYQNLFADPFNYFLTRTSGDADLFIDCWKRLYDLVEETDDFAGFDLSPDRVQPTVDLCAGSTADMEYVRSELAEDLKEPLVPPRLFYLMAQKSPRVAILKNDFIVHYSADSFRTYVKKLDWRVKANIHYPEVVAIGYVNREKYEPARIKLKKYLFMPYAFTLVVPLAQGISKAVRLKKPVALLHPLLSFYAASDICWQYLMKAVGRRPALRTYGSNAQKLDLD